MSAAAPGRIVAIIPARGGSKGIPRKNLMPVCGRPLIQWSVLQARACAAVESVWVSSDDDEILAVAAEAGARPVKRPAEISGDKAQSEAAWLHALDAVERETGPVGLLLLMQATSPIRAPGDIDAALAQYAAEGLDTLFSAAEVEDYFTWRRDEAGAPQSVNYDWRNRRLRQSIERRWLENGSFYLTRPAILRGTSNRLGGKIGIFVMDRFKMFQIDSRDDARLCEVIMHGYGYDRA